MRQSHGEILGGNDKLEFSFLVDPEKLKELSYRMQLLHVFGL
jgi:hypothetical protein